MIKNRLKELRKSKNVKVKDILEYTGLSQTYYYELETGVKRLNEETLHKLADFYKVTIDYILCRTDSENNIVLEGESLPLELKPYIDAISIDKNRKLSPDDIKNLIKTALGIIESNKN